ncbi:MAG: AMP-binding protein [Myxococcaceae bacterium]|nr:AMP-binding protein [Myxococcaceae bacterium]
MMTLSQMILGRAASSPSRAAFRVRRGETYADVTWAEVSLRVDAIAAGLLSAASLDDGACISIVGSTSLASCLVDFAALGVGLKTVPVYASLLPEEVGYMHVDTATQLIVVDDASQLEKVRAFRGGFTFFERRYAANELAVRAKVVVIHPGALAPSDDWESLDALEARGRAAGLYDELQRRRSLIRREQVATYTYTSGTTGAPKAVIQTHDNMLSMLEDVGEAGLMDAKVKQHGLFLFLPAAHSFGRMVEFAGPFFDAPIVLSSVPTLAADLAASRPGFFPAAPRVFEKMMAKIVAGVEGTAGVKRTLADWALRVGREVADLRVAGRPVPYTLELQRRLADTLVLSKLRARLGLDNASALLSGAAALRTDVQLFFLALGLTVLEAYGLTETCPGLTVNRRDDARPGTVGQAFERVELKVAPDGELLARGPNITRGYLNRPDATADVFDEEGWFHTGDLGSIDADGFVRITGRKKELLKTSGGKYVAPLKIEAQLKKHRIVQEAVVVGDGRNYCTALFALDAEMLASFDRAQVDGILKGLVDEANSTLAPFEQIKTFRVSPGPFTVDGGELTASLKVKRHVVAQKHAALIESMYAA